MSPNKLHSKPPFPVDETLKTRLPIPSSNEPVRSEQVLLVPGHVFFCEPVEVPEEMEPSEVDDFVELRLESISPFPPDQLHWGYLYRPGSEHLLLYAAHRDRIGALGFENLEAYAWVLPDFATLAGARFPEDTEIHYVSTAGLCLMRFAPDDPVPLSLVARPLGETDPPEILAEALHAHLPSRPDPVRDLSVSLAEARIDDQGRPTFIHEAPSERSSETQAWAERSPSAAELWPADIRNRAFQSEEQGRRQTSRLLTRATGWALWIALALLAGEILLLAGNAWLGGMRQQRQSQQAAVLTIQDKHTLITKLDQVARNELQPIEMLRALNSSRPEGIYFTSATADGENRVSVEGIANTVNELNNYTEQLKRSGRFRLVEDPKALTRSGQTTFTVRLEFVPNRPARRATGIPGVDETGLPDLPEEG